MFGQRDLRSSSPEAPGTSCQVGMINDKPMESGSWVLPCPTSPSPVSCSCSFHGLRSILLSENRHKKQPNKRGEDGREDLWADWGPPGEAAWPAQPGGTASLAAQSGSWPLPRIAPTARLAFCVSCLLLCNKLLQNLVT